jgi:Fis family transcriptional regulator
MTTVAYRNPLSLAEKTTQLMDAFYRNNLSKRPLGNVYQIIMSEVELPLLETTMKHAEGDISVAAAILGMSEAGLSKRLKKYHLIPA